MSRITATLIASLLLCATAPARAANFCVSTGEQLANALADAASNGQPDNVRVRSGVLTRASAATHDYTYSSIEGLDLSGGWTGASGACTTQNQQAGQTLLDGELAGGILYVQVLPSSAGTFSIRNLGFYRGAMQDNLYGSVSIEVAAATTAKVLFSRNSITQSISDNGGTAGLHVAINSGEIRVTGNLIVGNASQGTSGNGGAEILTSNGALTYFTNNTVSGNSRNSAQIGASGVYFRAMSPMWISNNVITGNINVPAVANQFTLDTNSSGAQFHLAHNHLGLTAFGAISSSHALSESGTLYGDPGFVSANDRRPRPDSILVDSGLSNAPGGIETIDISGLARPQGAAIERGAYELVGPLVFANGFD
jgi:hypothetical protein